MLTTKSFFRLAFGVLAVALSGVTLLAAIPALAQANLEPQASYQKVDRFGVNLVDGSLQISSPTITVGDPAHGGLSFTAYWDSKARDWRYSNWGSIKKEFAKPDPYCYGFYTLTYMGGANTFQREVCGSNNFDLIDGAGSLVGTASGYTYTAPDGSVALYDTLSILSITRPSGEVITYTYAGGLSSVSNNYGYQIHFDYGLDPLGGASLTKVTALNNAVDACALAAATCIYSVDWPSLTFSHPGTEYRVTDALNRTIRVIYDSNDVLTGKITGVARPTPTSEQVIAYTLQFVSRTGGGNKVTSVNDGAGTWTYGYEPYCGPYDNVCSRPTDTYDVDTTVTAPNGAQTVYNFFYAGRSYWTGVNQQELLLTPSLYSIKDALNQTTLISETGAGLTGITYPEGNHIGYGRHFGVVSSVGKIPKAGSGLSSTLVSMAYPECGPNPILCHRPISMTDARGAVTDYTYDAAGNLLTETGPAPTLGAARPQTRYTWEQRYAWYKRDGAATITQAALPVWVLVQTSQCVTGATCQ